MAAQLLKGVGFSASCYALPYLVVRFVLLKAPAGGTQFAFPIPFLGALYFVFAMACQLVATLWFVKKGRNLSAIGIWLLYPLVALSVLGYSIYVVLRIG